MHSRLQCIACGESYPIDRLLYICPACGGLLDICHDTNTLSGNVLRELFDGRLGTLDAPYRSGVWRYKELVYPDAPDDLIVSRPEGNTPLYEAPGWRNGPASAVCGSSTRAKIQPARSRIAA